MQTTNPKRNGPPASDPTRTNHTETLNAIDQFVKLQSQKCCGNCSHKFTKKYKPASLVGIQNGQMNSMYLICGACRDALRKQGTAGIPHAAKDAKLAYVTRMAKAQGGVQ
jgi:hypothetical protein